MADKKPAAPKSIPGWVNFVIGGLSGWVYTNNKHKNTKCSIVNKKQSFKYFLFNSSYLQSILNTIIQ